MIVDHLIIIYNIFLSFLIAIGLFSLIYLFLWISGLGLHIEKLAAYECGFYPFEDTRQMFRIRYYLIAILFIIFDLEIILLIPLIIYYPDFFFLIQDSNTIVSHNQEFVTIIIFLGIITLGFSYEWMKSALYWE
jgi:NADH-quinone oxidoreductase subunit A